MKLVVCEGEDDQAVIEGLARHAGLKDIRVEGCRGVDNFGQFLRGLPQRPEFTRREVSVLGIVLDADRDRAACWQRIQDRVREAFHVDLAAEGVFAGDRPRIGALITAVGNQGTLEDVVLEAVRNQPGFRCLEEYFRCLAAETGRPSYPAKARFRAWMASQADYDLRVGKAASGGYLPWTSAAFDSLRQFLIAL
jgi:hypothetical protein